MRPIFRWLALVAVALAIYVGFYRKRPEAVAPSGPALHPVSWSQAAPFSVVPTPGQPVGFPVTLFDSRLAQYSDLNVEIECDYQAIRTRPTVKSPWRTFSADELAEMAEIGGSLLPRLELSKPTVVDGKPAFLLWCEPTEIYKSGQWQIAATLTIYFSRKNSNQKWTITQPIKTSFVKPQTFTPSLHTLRRGVNYIARLQQAPAHLNPRYGNVYIYSAQGVPITPTPEPTPTWADVAPNQVLRAFEKRPLQLRAVPHNGLKWPIDGRNTFPRWQGRWSNGETEPTVAYLGETIEVSPPRISRDKNDLLIVSAEAGNRIAAKILVVPAPTPTPRPTPTPQPPTVYNIEFNCNWGQAYPVNVPNSSIVRIDLTSTVSSNQDYDTENPDELRIRFRAVDSEGRSFGRVSADGSDSRLVEAFNASSYLRAVYYAPTKPGKAVLWAELIDRKGHVLVKSSTTTLEFQDVRAWCEYGQWEATDKPDEWKRNVYAFAGLRSPNSMRPMPNLKVVGRVASPHNAKDSWLETSQGTTNEVFYVGSGTKNFPLTFVQHARWSPGGSFQLNKYQVVVQVKK